MSENDFRSSIDRQRRVPAQLASSITVPAFGVCQYFNSLLPSRLLPKSRQVVTVGRISTAAGAERLCINGPTPIVASPDGNGKGEVTFDYPTYVLYEYSDGTPAPGELWGPEVGSFFLRKGVGGFTILGGATGEGPNAMVRVERTKSHTVFYDSTFRNNLTEIQPGDPVAPVADIYRDPASEGQPSGVLATAIGLYTTLSGSYLFGFSGSLYSNSAPRGTQLTLRLYRSTNPDTVISGSADMTATSYNVVRTQDIETDEYGADILTTMENVAMGGPIQLTAGDSIAIINDSAYPVVVAAVNFWAMLVMPHAVDAEGE